MSDDNNITNLQVGIGADLSKLNADLEQAEKKIANLGKDQDGKPIKVTVDPFVDVKAFIAKVQEAVKSQTVKVKVDATVASASKAGAGKGVSKPQLPGIVDASEQLDFFEDKIAKIKQVAGNIDVSVKVDTNAMGEVTRGVITYTNALGQAKSETYKLVNIFDDVGEVAGREFQRVGESFSESKTKAARFRETIQSLENTLNAFANKHADIGDQIGIDDLRAKFAALKEDTNAEVTAIQQFKNEMGAAKVKADEIYAAQRARVASERQQSAEARAMLQGQLAHEQALNELRSVSSSSYRQEQQKITAIMQKQLDILNQKIAAEKRSSSGSKQAIAAVQLQKATIQTTGYTAKLSVYAKDVAKQVEKARNNMEGMQGYARSTANIFKGIVLSQAFYKGMNAVKGVVKDAWELSMALNSAEAVFSGMLTGGQQQAQGLLEVLKQEAIATPFDLNNLVQATRQLTAYGIRAENLMYVMRAVEQATAASGDKSKMEAISRALGQMYTRGKVVSQEIIQLQEAGIAAGEILKEELGLPDSLSQDWGKLNIDANTAINAIVRGIDKRYGQALDNMAKTTEQKLSNMKESFALIAGSLTDPIRRGIDSIIDVITPKIERLYQAIQAVGLGNALKTLLPQGLFDGVVRAIDRVVRAVQTLGIVFKQIKPIVTAVMNAVSAHAQFLYNVFISIAAAVGAVGNALGESASGAALLENGIRKLLLVMFAFKVAMAFVAAATKIWAVAVTVLRGVGLAIQGVIIGVKAMSAMMVAAGMSGAMGFLPVVGIILVIIGLVSALSGKFSAMAEAIKGVGTALKNLGGGTNLGGMFEDMSSSLQEQIDAYNKKVAEENARLNNELIENEEKQTEEAENAAGATKKAMKGLMSFDEVYKLMEASAGGGSTPPIEIELPPITGVEMGGVFDGVGGIADDLFKDLDLTELQDALGGLWVQLSPMLETILIYGAKMLGYFKQMQLYSKLMTGENKEQWTLEKSQTSEDQEQTLHEKSQTSEDQEQVLHEKAQTSEDQEQVLHEKAQTSEDQEQVLHEKAQTVEDQEQLLQEKAQTVEDREQLLNEQLQTSEDREQLANEKLQTAEDKEQLAYEKLQTSEDKEQLANEKLQTSEDKEQLLNEQLQTTQDKEQLLQEQLQTTQGKEQNIMTITRTDGTGGTGGTGQKATAGALALINVAQLASSVKLISNDIKDLREDGATVGEWISLLVDALMAAVDVFQLYAVGKLLFGGAGKGVGSGIGTAVAGAAKGGSAVGGAAEAGSSVAGTIEGLDTATGKLSPKLSSLAKNLAMGIVIIAEVAAAAIIVVGAIWALGKLLEQVGLAWQPVIDNGDTILTAMGLGVAILAAVGVVTWLLGSVGTGLIVNMALGMAVLAEIGIAAGLFLVEIWAIGKGLDEIGKAWQPVLDNGDNIVTAIGLGTAILIAVGAVTALLGVAAVATAGLLPLAIGLGTAMLVEVGIAAALFLTEIWAIGKGLDEIGKAWQPVLDNGDTIVTGIELGTALLIAIGVVTAALGVASVASVGLLPLAIGLGTSLLVSLAESFIKFTDSLIDVAGQLGNNLAPALSDLNGKLPGLSSNMERFVGFMTTFAGHVVTYTKASAVAGLSATIDTIIGWFTKDPIKKLSDDVEKIRSQVAGLNEKLNLAVPELKSAAELLGSYQSFMDEISSLMNNNSNLSLPDQMFVNLKEVGEKLITGFAKGIMDYASVARGAMELAMTTILKAEQRIDGTEGSFSTTYAKQGYKVVSGFAKGISSNTYMVTNSFKTLLNNMLGLMERFTNNVAVGLNAMLTNFSKTMGSMSASSSGSVNFSRMNAPKMTRLADGGIVHRAASGVQMLKKKTKLASNVEAGEAGAEIVFPLENTQFIKSFADEIAVAVGNNRTQQAAMNINVQMDQARAGAGTAAFNAPTATEISDAIRSWFTPQMQSLHDVLEQDRSIDIKVPNTSNALWRALLSELKEANAGAGSRGLAFTS